MIKLDRFFGGKRHILTFGFDDGMESDIQLIEILNRYKMKATFFLNSGLLNQAGYIKSEDMEALYDGHETACHGADHLPMGRIPFIAVGEQIMTDRKRLEAIVKRNVTGFSYPMSVYNENVIKTLSTCGIAYARDSRVSGNFSMPDDFYRWHPTCHQKNAEDFCDSFQDNVTKFTWRTSLFYIYGHSFEFERENNWHYIENICKKLSGMEDVWYATGIEICRYVKGLSRLEFSADLKRIYNPSAMPLWISCDDEAVKIDGGSTVELS